MRRLLVILSVFGLSVFAASTAQGGSDISAPCGTQAFAYAGEQANRTGHGIAADLVSMGAPNVTDGHVGGWVGVGGTQAGPGGAAEWLQTGLAAFPGDSSMQMYYEVTVAGAQPKYVELDSSVAPGDVHKFSVLEMANHPSWWRVWVDGKPASPPIDLPGSHDSWYPQAVAENWNGNAGACNTYAYTFSNVSIATADGGSWRPLQSDFEWNDPGYHMVALPHQPHAFMASNLAV